MGLSTKYIQELFVQEDEVLKSIPESLTDNNMPLISVSPEIGRLLYMLAKISGSKNILEVGTLGGYSTISLARALPENGKVTTFELKPEHAKVAASNIEKAGLTDKVEIRIGDAKELLKSMLGETERFDFFFIDAEKTRYPYYLELAMQLASPGALIIFDNLLLNGRVYDLSDQFPGAVAVRTLNQTISSHPKLESILLDIGDGVGICRVKR